MARFLIKHAQPRMAGLTASPAQVKYMLHVEASAGARILPPARDPWLHHSGVFLLQLAAYIL